MTSGVFSVNRSASGCCPDCAGAASAFKAELPAKARVTRTSDTDILMTNLSRERFQHLRARLVPRLENGFCSRLSFSRYACRRADVVEEPSGTLEKQQKAFPAP